MGLEEKEFLYLRKFYIFVAHVVYGLSPTHQTIKLFCVKCEQAAKADSDASQVIGKLNNTYI